MHPVYSFARCWFFRPDAPRRPFFHRQTALRSFLTFSPGKAFYLHSMDPSRRSNNTLLSASLSSLFFPSRFSTVLRYATTPGFPRTASNFIEKKLNHEDGRCSLRGTCDILPSFGKRIWQWLLMNTCRIFLKLVRPTTFHQSEFRLAGKYFKRWLKSRTNPKWKRRSDFKGWNCATGITRNEANSPVNNYIGISFESLSLDGCSTTIAVSI